MVFLVGLGPTPLVSNDSPWINVSLKIVNCSCVVPPICQNLQWNTMRLFFFVYWFFGRCSFPGLSQRYLFIGVRRNLLKESKKGRGRLTPILQVLTLFKVFWTKLKKTCRNGILEYPLISIVVQLSAFRRLNCLFKVSLHICVSTGPEFLYHLRPWRI